MSLEFVTLGIQPPHYRLPAATRLGAVTLQVSQLNRSLEFYERVLGLSILVRNEDAATLTAAGDRRPLVHLRAEPGVRPVPRGGRLGLYHFALLLPDRAALGRFVSHLGGIGARAGSADHAVSEALYLWDPDGLGIEVYIDRPRTTWRLESGELFMSTEPLNLQDLVQSAGGQPWAGMPAGTVLGHMHLHVGDLESAAAFYHVGLGFDKTVWSYPGALFLSAGGYHHHLGTNTWAASVTPAGAYDARLLQWEIVLPSGEDCDAAGRSLEAAGFVVRRDDRSRIVADPWGTTLRLVPQS